MGKFNNFADVSESLKQFFPAPDDVSQLEHTFMYGYITGVALALCKAYNNTSASTSEIAESADECGISLADLIEARKAFKDSEVEIFYDILGIISKKEPLPSSLRKSQK